MANIAPANFAYVNANGDKGDVQVLSAADITLLNEGLQDIEDLKLAVQKPLPAGTIIPFAGNVVPAGFLVCNGAAVSRTDYANLFAAIGTLYGAGDGSTTFNLPDYRGRVLQGADDSHAAGTYIAAGLPNITGMAPVINDNQGGIPVYGASQLGTPNGVFSFSGAAAKQSKCDFHAMMDAYSTLSSTYTAYFEYTFSAHRSNALYDKASTVQPLATAIQYLIKY